MKKIFWRVFVAFGVVLLVFTILIGLMFTRFNRTNIVGAYKQQGIWQMALSLGQVRQ